MQVKIVVVVSFMVVGYWSETERGALGKHFDRCSLNFRIGNSDAQETNSLCYKAVFSDAQTNSLCYKAMFSELRVKNFTHRSNR